MGRIELWRTLLVRKNVRDGAKALTVLVATRPRRKAFENFMVGFGWRVVGGEDNDDDERCVRAWRKRWIHGFLGLRLVEEEDETNVSPWLRRTNQKRHSIKPDLPPSSIFSSAQRWLNADPTKRSSDGDRDAGCVWGLHVCPSPRSHRFGNQPSTRMQTKPALTTLPSTTRHIARILPPDERPALDQHGQAVEARP
jgi:hypothetical protein